MAETLKERSLRIARESAAYHNAAKQAAQSSRLPQFGGPPPRALAPSPTANLLDYTPNVLRKPVQPRPAVINAGYEPSVIRRNPGRDTGGAKWTKDTRGANWTAGGAGSAGGAGGAASATSSAAPKFVGPNQPRMSSPVSPEGMAFRNRPAFETVKPVEPKPGKFMSMLKTGGKVGANVLGKFGSIPAIGAVMPGIDAYRAYTDPNLTEQQKTDAYVRAGLEGTGGVAGGALGSAAGSLALRAAPFLPGVAKPIAALLGVGAGTAVGKAIADNWLAEAPRSDTAQVSNAPLVQGQSREPTADELGIPPELEGMNVNPISDGAAPMPFMAQPAQIARTPVTSVRDYISKIQGNASMLPEGAVEIIRGLSKSYALPTTVNGPMPEIDEGIFRPGVAQGREFMDSFGGSERAAAASITSDARVQAANIAANAGVAAAGMRQSDLNMSKLRAGAIADIVSGDDARVKRGQEILAEIQAMEQGNNGQSELAVFRQSLGAVMLDPEATPAEKAQARQRLLELKQLELLGVQ